MAIQITQGDTATFQMTANLDSGSGAAPFDLTGAVFETRLHNADGTVLVIPNSAHTLLDQLTNKGRFNVALTSAQTQVLRLGGGQTVQTSVVQGASTLYFKARVLTVDPRELG